MSTSRSLTWWMRCFCLLIAAFGLAVAVHAQSTTEGAISGTVIDTSGAAVANAKVTVKNNGTNVEQSSTTDETGFFRFSPLAPASYTVTIEAQGFAKYSAEKVIVQVGTVTDLNPNLAVASAGATVVVNAEIPQVNTTSPEFAPVIDQTAINNLPINGGRWSNFVLLTPGAVNDLNGFGLISFRGMSTLLNNNTVDGGDNNQAFFAEERGRTRIGYSSAKAAVQEFQVNTSNYSAEYGRAAGAVVNTVTKSGTNEYHGEVYFYDRNNDWGATNPFTTLTTQQSPGVFVTNPYKPEDVRYMYGFGVGGPIIKDKLFFFFAFDRYDRNFPGTAKATSPSAFFAAPTAATINTLAARLGITPAAATTLYNNGLNDLLSETGPVPRKGQATIFFPKIDWQINDKNHAVVEVNRMRWTSPAGIQTQASNTFGVASFGNDYVRATWGVAKLYTILTNTLSNEARFQYGRDFEFEFAQPPTQYEANNFLTNPLFPAYTNPLGLPPDVFITNGFDMGVPTFLQRPAFPDERRTQFSDTLNWSHGKHALKFGIDYAHTNDLSENLRTQYGSYSYSSLLNYFSDLNGVNTCTTGTAPNVFQVPCYSTYSQAFGPLGFEFNTNDYAFFIEDSWRIRPRLTLNIGIRYEYEQLPSPILPNSAVPQTQSFPSDNNNVGPRIGFAWDVFGDGKTAVRGGYGIYYGRLINSTIYSALTSTAAGGAQLSYSLSPTSPTTRPCAPSFPIVLSTNPVCPTGLSLVYLDKNFQLPQIHQTDLTIERELPWNIALSVSYLGSFGRSLPDFVDTNISPATTSVTYNVGTGGPIADPTYTTVKYTARVNPAFGAMTDIFSGISSNYNALAIQVNKRMSNNVQFSYSYTWSHALDFGTNGTTFNDTNDLLDPFNIQAEYGNSVFDVRQRSVLSAVVTTPWKKAGALGYLVNGWLVAPIYQAQSGLPYSLVTSGNAPTSLSSGINGSNGRKGIDIVGRNTFSFPRTQNVDLRISKKFNFTERFAAELIGEGFNLFNHVNATAINNTGYIIATTGTTTTANGTVPCSTASPCLNFNAPFGSVTNANSNFAYSSRQVQIGVRFLF